MPFLDSIDDNAVALLIGAFYFWPGTPWTVSGPRIGFDGSWIDKCGADKSGHFFAHAVLTYFGPSFLEEIPIPVVDIHSTETTVLLAHLLGVGWEHFAGEAFSEADVAANTAGQHFGLLLRADTFTQPSDVLRSSNAPACDYCWLGRDQQANCPISWNGTDDGCDCGCQFIDPDCR
jgi:hypothetical protein